MSSRTKLNEMITEIRQKTANGDVDVDELMKLVDKYEFDEEELRPYIGFSPNKYTRNLIDTGNGKYNLILLCWNMGTKSSIHDHSNSNCILKCLKGTLQEKRYESLSTNDAEQNDQEQPMNCFSDQEIHAGVTTLMHDKIGLHSVGNPSSTQPAISLHLYMPPFSLCHCYDERTGKQSTVPMIFDSINGSSRSHG